MPIQLQLQANTIPPGTCFPPTWQQALSSIAQNVSVSGLNSLTFFWFGPTVPPTDYQGSPWIKTDAQYKFLGIYTFTNGSWQPAAPPILPGTILDFYGDAGSVVAPYYICNGQAINGPLSGALTTPNLSGLVTVGAGTNPATGTNFANQSTGGEEKHTPTIAEMAAHTHPPLEGKFVIDAAGVSVYAGGGFGTVDSPSTTGSTGGGQAFNVLQSYMALWKIIFWP